LPVAERPTLVYFPGLDGTGRLLHRQPALHEAFRVECVSYPQLEYVRYEQLAELGAERIRAAGGEAVVVAESFGGAVGLTLALEHPELVSRLVLVNTFAYFPRRMLIGLGAFLGRFLPARPSPPSTRPLRGYFFFAPEVPPAERDEWWQRTADVPTCGFGLRMRLLHGLDLRPRLREITIPALVIASVNDKVVPSSAGRELARLLPNARLMLARVGHAALIHPRIDLAKLLADPALWPRPLSRQSAAAAASS
jgi:pimeloyl-ACP methyl ester carboxylesterase